MEDHSVIQIEVTQDERDDAIKSINADLDTLVKNGNIPVFIRDKIDHRTIDYFTYNALLAAAKARARHVAAIPKAAGPITPAIRIEAAGVAGSVGSRVPKGSQA